MKTTQRYVGLITFLVAIGAAQAQTPPSSTAKPAPKPGATRASVEAHNADLEKYNQAVTHFNTLTASTALKDAQEAYRKNPSEENKAALSAAQAKLTDNIAELQAVLQLPSYQNATATPETKPNLTATQATLHNLIGYLYLTRGGAGDPDLAITELQTTVQLSPDSLDARNNLGNALRDANPPRYDEAATQYQYILDHPKPAPAPGAPTSAGPDPASVKFNLATVYGQSGHLDQSLPLFKELVDAGNADAAVYKNYGFFLQKAGKGAEAADILRAGGKLNSKDAGVWLNAGELYAKAGNQDEAITALTNALAPDADPKLDVQGQYDAHFALGEAYAAKGDPNQAIKEFDMAAQLQPQNAVPLYNKGVLQEQAGLRADAVTAYRAALAIDPNNVQIQTALGLLLADQDNSAEAVTLLAAVAPRLPQDAKAAPVYARLGDMYAKQNDAANAKQARLQALALNPDDADTRLTLADSYMAQNQYYDALEQYDLAAKSRPGDAAIQNQRGVAYKNLKQYPKALAAFRRALALNPRNAQVQNNIGVLYELLGNRAQAIVAYRKALAIDPSLAQARLNLNRFTVRNSH